MEYFNKVKGIVKLRSHLDKYLVADDDGEKVRQSRNGSSRKAKWMVEFVENKNHVIRLKGCHGHYLAASDVPFLLGMTGKKVIQSPMERDENDVVSSDWIYEWEPIRDGFQVKLKSWCGKYLRANGGTPPWRNSITHDEPHTGSTQNWILWDIEEGELTESESVADYLSSLSTLSSVSDDILSELGSPVVSATSSFKSPRFSFKSQKKQQIPSPKLIDNISFRSAIDIFHNAKAVRLRSHHDKFLLADEDEESVIQGRNGSSKNARWTIEFVTGSDSVIRLKSNYNKYLTASNHAFLLGMTGQKVVQSLPRGLDSSIEWEPIKEGNHVKFKTRSGHFLRANTGLPPWRNSVTHDIPYRTSTQDWILWHVEIVEIEVQSPRVRSSAHAIPHSDSLDSESSSPSIKSGNYSRQESTNSYVDSPPKLDGRTIYYHIADGNGEVNDESVEGYSFTFRGNEVEELTRRFEEETGIEGIVMCTRSPLNGKLYPLRLQLPPNNVTMHVVVLLSQSKAAAKELESKGLL
ncbi:uncharacterized protein LOC115712813 isoform X1 [Cannabis sativa]|uniref:uncharacterized protein LOC115712813 isoform X1 n=1 Tax=Cannabis sativa TaxID=3483 RepID=UPI0029CA33E1|nr:uncharacterized protein LOC115712813 isoform X1 [Cannabis sativa]